MKLMNMIVVSLFLVMSSLWSKTHIDLKDDWDENLTRAIYRSHDRPASKIPGTVQAVMPVSAVMSASPLRMAKQQIGFSVGGAKDVKSFEENIKAGYLPPYDSITYEGTFYQHYFDTGRQSECKHLFCPSYATAVTHALDGKGSDYYISVGLNSGIEADTFRRPKLNLVVVIDISGSMRGSFDRYYYDPKKGSDKDTDSSKMAIANRAIVAMLGHLLKEDRLGVVLFNNRAYRVKPLSDVAHTDMDAIKGHILALEPKGGTNWSAGYQAALSYFEKVSLKGYENRIVFITDAMPNQGELRKEGLLGMTKAASERGIHTTFIGVGIDFNTKLVSYVSKVKGANYYAVHTAEEFSERLDDAFDYMVTPLVYDLELKLVSNGYRIEAVYGAPHADRATGRILKVDTLFPSASREGRVKGGIILLRLKQIGKDRKVGLVVSYRDRAGKVHRTHKRVDFRKKRGFDTPGIRKAILLSHYVTLMKNWIIDARAECVGEAQDLPPVTIMQHSRIYPPMHPYYPQLPKWEERSCPLSVDPVYGRIFKRFRDYFVDEMKQLHDRSLTKELEILSLLIRASKAYREPVKVDRWPLPKP